MTGFIEADGNFYCSFDLNSEGRAEIVKSYMRISQKQMYKTTSDKPSNSNFQIMERIREFLDVKNVNEIKRTKKDYVELSYSSPPPLPPFGANKVRLGDHVGLAFVVLANKVRLGEICKI